MTFCNATTVSMTNPGNLFRLLACLFALAGTTAFSSDAVGELILDWQASSGNLPDVNPNEWSLVDSAEPEEPSLASGVLTLSSSEDSENMYYFQSDTSDDDVLDTSSPFYIEATMRFDSGTTNSSWPSRAPVMIGFSTAPGVGNALFIDSDSMFFNLGGSTHDAKLTDYDTDDAFHTYRIDYDGAGGFTLQYDGLEIYSGTTFTSSAFNSTEQRIFWGEGSIQATGLSEWTSFRHNALVPEPSSGLAMLVGASLPGLTHRRNRQCRFC